MKNKYSANVVVTLNIPVNIISECHSVDEARNKALNVVYEKLTECELIPKSKIELGGVNVNVTKVDETIMDDTNNHNKELVKLVNDIFNDNSRRSLFISILDALFDRDEEGVNVVLAYKRPFACGSFFEGVEEDKIYSLIHDYLMHIADDKDLQTIICFCRK